MNRKTKSLRERVLEHFDALRIPITADELDKVLASAEHEGLPVLEVLDRLLGEQAARRRERSIKRRIDLARFAEHKTSSSPPPSSSGDTSMSCSSVNPESARVT